MRQIADLGARALDDAPVVLDQRIGLVGQRLDLGGKASVEPLRRALAHHGQRIAHPAERPQPEQDRHGVDGDHADAENRQIGKKPPLEGGDFVFQFGAVAHDAKPRDAVLAVQHEFAFDDLDVLAGQARGRGSRAGIRR